MIVVESVDRVLEVIILELGSGTNRGRGSEEAGEGSGFL